MGHYLLSVHLGVEKARPPTGDDERRGYERIAAVESEMKAAGALLFSGRLAEPDAASVVRVSSGKRSMTDGPFSEAKEHIGGFYIIAAADRDEALAWAAKTSEAIARPIEVWPFSAVATGERAGPA